MAASITKAFGIGMPRHGFRKNLLCGVALSVILGSTARGADPATDPKKADSAEIVTVTAQRRTQNLQDVPISIQVLSGETLKRLNVENFDDLIKQLPNVTAAGFGPGQKDIYMRGLSIGGDQGGQGGGGVGSFPNVAVYLDDQSAQIPGRNLDIYAVDLQQVEVLEGPQGTLFGSGAQGGVLRYITNKPDLSKFSANVDGGLAGTLHGALSYNGDFTVNMPVVKDKFAVRLTMYDDLRGGYIDNVPGTFVRESTDLGIHVPGYTNNIPGPATAQNSINNSRTVNNDINPATYQGVRAEALYKFDEDWNVLLTESAQRLNADGVFYEMPETSGSNPVKLPPLSVQTFEPSSDKDFFENTALTITGRVGILKVVYDGAYLIRDTHQVQDYTNYARGLYADYYQCQPAGKYVTKPTCYSPGATWEDIEHDTHLSQELRVSTPDEWRLRAIGGFFYEDFQIQNQTNFNYLTAPYFTPIAPPPGSTAVDPSTRSYNTGFFNDITRGYSQYAIFGSADYDIIPHVLTVTAGTRWFDFHNFENGSAVSGYSCNNNTGYSGPSPCLVGATNLDAKHLENGSYGFRSRANITWKITPDIMVYYTWSQGYRPGGFNRRAPKTSVDGVPFVGPIEYKSDDLVNNEVGYKMQFFDHRLTIDGAFYQEKWNNVQDRLFDPGAFGNLAFTVNGPNYRVRGTEVQLTARPTDNLTFNGSIALNDTRQQNSPPVTSPTGEVLPGSEGIFGNVGDTLAQSPAFKGTAHVRYAWDIADYLPFVQFGITHSSHMHSAVASFNNYYEHPITTLDMSAGVSRDAWRAQLYVDNLTDERGQEFISAAQFVKSIIVTRPLTAGVRLSYAFR
jgi:outer membrane receptor protein involved in Fe transport